MIIAVVDHVDNGASVFVGGRPADLVKLTVG
jgi:hypothetical protein